MKHGRRLAAWSAFAALLPVLAGCGGSSTALRYPVGTALRELDLTQMLTVRGTVAGRDYGFAFPVLRNHTSSPVTIDAFAIHHLPPGVSIARYRAFSTRRFGYLIGSHIGDGTDEDYSTYPNLFRPGKTSIPARSAGGLLFAVDLHVRRLHAAKVYATGCEVDYHLSSGVHHSQSLPCMFGFQRSRDVGPTTARR